MKILEIDYTTTLEFDSPIVDHYFLLRCVPVSGECQTVMSRSLVVKPEVQLNVSKDIFENMSYQGRIDFPHNIFSFHSTATVIVDRENGVRDNCHPFYRYNTPLTFCDENMKNFLHSVFKDTSLAESVEKRNIRNSEISMAAEFLMSAIHDRVTYVPGSTTVKTTAAESFALGTGVCQDYSHIFCSLCREAGIAARYVAGTSSGEGATHAWAEYFVPDDEYAKKDGTSVQGRWFGIDCTRNRKVDDSYVSLACGRDYLDCKVDGGIFRGMANQKMTVFVKTNEKEIKNNSINSGIKHQLNSTNLEEQKKMLRMKNQQQQM